MRSLPLPARLYVGAVILLGAGLFVVCFPGETLSSPWLFLLLLALSSITSVYLTYRTYKIYLGRIDDEQRHVRDKRRPAFAQRRVVTVSDAHLAAIPQQSDTGIPTGFDDFSGIIG
jgi:membrane protein implicated in regulation of membrane protease activity